jgi:hypothetical protein
MESIACNLCGSWDHEFVYEMPDALVERRMVQGRSLPRVRSRLREPSAVAREIDNYYPEDFFREFTEHDARHRVRYEREADLVERYATGRGRLLDVGCANGAFPRLMLARG